MKFIVFIIAFFALLQIGNSQSFDVIPETSDMSIHISGKEHTGVNTVGNSYLYFHRNNDSEQGLVKWNLNRASDLYAEIDMTEDIDYWQTGIDGNDDFKISKYKHRYAFHTGSLELTTDVMVIKDVYSGDNPFTDARVIFPEGSVEIGSGKRILGYSDHSIQIENANLVPYDCGWDLGTESIPWASIYGQDYYTIERCLDPVEAYLKREFSGITAIKKVNSLYRSINKKYESGRFYLDPDNLKKAIPEAVIEYTNDNESIDLSEKVYGINYNQIIPVLIKAVQEQQEQIEWLTAQIETK